MFHQLMVGISIFDGLSSITFILGTLPVPENTSIYGARGTEATCRFQGKMICDATVPDPYGVNTSNLLVSHTMNGRLFWAARLDVSSWTDIHVLQCGTFNLLFAGN